MPRGLLVENIFVVVIIIIVSILTIIIFDCKLKDSYLGKKSLEQLEL